MLWIIVAIVIIVVGLAFIWITYNGLVKSRNQVDESWSGISVQLKRRADLIPNLVETVKGYAAHESEVFEHVTQARTAMLGAADQGPAAAATAEPGFQGAMKSLFAVAEAYPDLRASENFQQLQLELSGTENQVAEARRSYNGAVRGLNTKIQSFPANLFARPMGFSEREFYDVPDAAAIQAPPTVQF